MIRIIIHHTWVIIIIGRIMDIMIIFHITGRYGPQVIMVIIPGVMIPGGIIGAGIIIRTITTVITGAGIIIVRFGGITTSRWLKNSGLSGSAVTRMPPCVPREEALIPEQPGIPEVVLLPEVHPR